MRELAPAGHREPNHGCQAVRRERSGAGDPCPRDRRARTFADDEALLGDVLAAVIRAGDGEAALELHGRSVALAQRARAGDDDAADELAALVAGLTVAEADVFIRSLTRWFQLLNLAEDNERVRRLRARGDESPGSVREPSGECRRGGVSADELTETLAAAELRLVLTAHPTEARRRTTIEKLARIFGTLRELDDGAIPERAAFERLAEIAQELWASDDVRTVALDVADEVQRRARLPLHHARADGAGRVPRDRVGDRRAVPRRGGADPAAAHVRLVDGRRPRRQPQRDAGGDGRDARPPCAPPA